MSALHSLLRNLLAGCCILVVIATSMPLWRWVKPESVESLAAVILHLAAGLFLCGFCIQFTRAVGDYYKRHESFQSRLNSARAFLIQFAAAVVMRGGVHLIIDIQTSKYGYNLSKLVNAVGAMVEEIPMIAAAYVLTILVAECATLRDEQERTI